MRFPLDMGRDVRLFADVKLLLEQLDQAELDGDIGICAVLPLSVSCCSPLTTTISWLGGHTLIVSSTSASTFTVRFLPGTGGSGDTEIDLICLRKEFSCALSCTLGPGAKDGSNLHDIGGQTCNHVSYAFVQREVQGGNPPQST